MTVQREDRGTTAAASEEPNLDLPLIDDQDSELWADAATVRHDRSVWPALTEALSDAGRKLLWDGLREAVDATPGDPDRALMVVEAFWRTMQLRRGPNYQRRITPDRLDPTARVS
jgi:hypothetical protein